MSSLPLQNNKTGNILKTDKKFANITNNITDYKYFVVIIIICLIVGIIYTNSKSYLVKKTLKQFSIIEKYNHIKSYDEDANKKLKELKISSAFNCVNRYRCILDYQDKNILKNILRLGCRYIELNIFPKSFKNGSKPMINSGFKNGQWKLMINSDLKFSQCINVIKKNAFTQLTNLSGAPNYKDPLFIGLNLHTGYNIGTLDKVAEIIIDALADRLLPPKYSYQYDKDFQDIKFIELQHKVVLFASPGFEGSKLEELINASWIDDSQLNIRDNFINYFSSNNNSTNNDSINNEQQIEKFNNVSNNEQDDLYDKLVSDITNKKRIIRISAKTINSYGFNKEYLREHNKNGLTIVVPNIEGDVFSVNYDASMGWDLGCQFVCMNFQELDTNIDRYVTEFRRQAIKIQ
jgi:hypothetical protein